jgi:Spherulation-specific family 4
MHKLLSFSLISCIRGISAALAALALAAGHQAQATGLIIPLYGNTSSQFNAAISAAQRVSMIAIINPDDGPGSSKVSGISSNVSKLRAVGAITAGYIDSYYGGESLSSVYTQISHHQSWYGIDAVFIDEMSNRSNKLSYYRSIYEYAKRKGLKVIGNPGTNTLSSYSAVADTLVTFEDKQSNGWASHSPSSWTQNEAASKIAAIIYAASSGTYRSVIDRAISRRYGWVFVTDGSGADPFRSAPGFLSSEADYLRGKNGGKK